MKVVEDTYAFAELNEEEGKTTKLKWRTKNTQKNTQEWWDEAPTIMKKRMFEWNENEK